MFWLLLHVWKGRPWMNTGTIPRRVARPHNAPVSSVTTLLAGGGFSRPKVQSWAKVQLSNDLKQGQLTVVQKRATLTVTSGISALQPCYLMCRQGQKPTLQRGGKRGAKDRGQTGSCGELKSHTKAYLEITEPRGWKRIPPSVIVSHVLLPPCNIFQINARSSLLYSKDTLQFHRGKKKLRNHRRGIAFSTAHEIMSCRSCCAWVQLTNYSMISIFHRTFIRRTRGWLKRFQKGFISNPPNPFWIHYPAVTSCDFRF